MWSRIFCLSLSYFYYFFELISFCFTVNFLKVILSFLVCYIIFCFRHFTYKFLVLGSYKGLFQSPSKLLVLWKLFGFLVSETSVRYPFLDFKQASSFSRLGKIKEPFRLRQMTYVMCATIKEVNIKFSSKQ